MANSPLESRVLVVGLIATVAAVSLTAGSVLSSLSVPDGYINPREHYKDAVRPSTRTEPVDASALKLQEQNLRNIRLQQLQAGEEDALHRAAVAEGADVVTETLARRYFRARKHCNAIGYTRSRLANCIHDVASLGSYED